jgi:hypothetical protein
VARTDDEIQSSSASQSALGIQEGDGSRKDEITRATALQRPAGHDLSQRRKSMVSAIYWEIGRNVFFALLALGMFVFFLRC